MLRITVFSIILMVTFVATSLAQENMAPTIMGPETLTIDELVLSTGTRTVSGTYTAAERKADSAADAEVSRTRDYINRLKS